MSSAAAPAKDATSSIEGRNLAAVFHVPLIEGAEMKIHRVEVEHGTVVTGKRIVTVDGVRVVHQKTNFSFTGIEDFNIGRCHCQLLFAPPRADQGVFDFQYELQIDEKPLHRYFQDHPLMTTWLPMVAGKPTWIMLVCRGPAIYIDGTRMESVGELMDSDDEDDNESPDQCRSVGSKQNFVIDDIIPAYVKITNARNKYKPFNFELYINDKLVVAATPDAVAKRCRIQ